MKLYSPIHPKTLFNLIHVVLFQGNNISKPFYFYMFFPNEGTTETQKGFKLNNSYCCDIGSLPWVWQTRYAQNVFKSSDFPTNETLNPKDKKYLSVFAENTS